MTRPQCLREGLAEPEVTLVPSCSAHVSHQRSQLPGWIMHTIRALRGCRLTLPVAGRDALQSHLLVFCALFA